MKRLSPSTRHIEYSKSASARRKAASRRGGFTLIELMVVIAIAAILSALLLGGFFNMSASNKRLSCQTNLQTIYGALRMYAADNDGAYPYYNDSSASNNGVAQAVDASGNDILKQNEMGLWALYTTQGAGDIVSPATHNDAFAPTIYTTLDSTPTSSKKPLGIYLRNSGSLHCPADRENAELYNADRTEFNPNYLSYQTLDNGAESLATPGPNVATYQSQRVTVTANANWRRQLLFWNGTQRVFDQRPASNTVITWCKRHRTGLGGRNSDPILYADGSVRSVPLTLPTVPIEMGWTR